MARAKRPIRWDRATVIASAKRYKKSAKYRRNRARAKREEQKVARGSNVSTRNGVEAASILYGRTRVGGATTFVETNADSKAYHVSNSGNSQIVYIANVAGATGNDISVETLCSGTQGAIAITVVDEKISIRLKSTAGVSESSALDVILAVNADASAAALVLAHWGDGDGSGTAAAESETHLRDGGGTWLHQVITLACHEIDAIETLLLNDTAVTFGASPDPRWAIGDYSGRVFLALNAGGDNQTAQPDLAAQLPARWTADHRQRGHAHAYLILVWSSGTFPEGLPTITFQVRGKKVYDPRTAQTVWSNNAALVIADYLTDARYGLGVAYGDFANLDDAADICDETITTIDGSEARYTINGAIDTSESPSSVLEQMASAIAGEIVFQGGRWWLFPGTWRTPAIALSESDIRGALSVEVLQSRSSAFNSVRGTYSAPSANYERTDFPPIKNDLYLSEDGEQIWEDFDLPLITSPSQCQRVAKIFLERARQSISVSGVFGLEALAAQVGDVVTLTVDKYGWSAKQFEVRGTAISLAADIGATVEMELAETAEGIYDWSVDEETKIDLAPNTDLPDPSTVYPPTSLLLESGTEHLYIRADGTIFSRLYLEWIAPKDVFVTDGGRYEIEYRKVEESGWTPVTFAAGGATSAYILDVQDGAAYDVRIRAVNAIGAVSEWCVATGHVVVGKTAPPSDVAGLAAIFSDYQITLSWIRITDLDFAAYEIRRGATWESAAFVTQLRGTMFIFEPLAAGAYTFLVRALDTSGNYSTSSVSATITVSAPSTPTGTADFIGPDVLLDWNESSGSFAIADYSLFYGDEFATSTLIATTKATTYRLRVTWQGGRTFWIEPRDIHSNTGSPLAITTAVALPGEVQSLGATVIDNNVLLKWSAPTSGTLPVEYYRVLRGATFAAATLIGTTPATFSVVFEVQSGNYTYWIVGYDTAGNAGTERSVSATVLEPPDFDLVDQQTLSSGTAVSAVEDPTGTVILTANTTETFEEHFTANSWTSPQDQIDDGYSYFLEPSPTSGSWSKVYDIGALIDATTIRVAETRRNLVGTPTVTKLVAYSTDGISWGEVQNSDSVFAASLRFVRVTYQVGEELVAEGTPLGLLLAITGTGAPAGGGGGGTPVATPLGLLLCITAEA